jgi:rhamnose transport system ATP-binding protein
MRSPVLLATSIAKSFEGVRALRNVSFELLPGEVHALIGENGAGKSTLIKIITGAVTADAGSITIDGQAVQRNSPSLSRSLGVAAVYQQPSLFPHLSISENIALSLESRRLWRRLNWRNRAEAAGKLLKQAGCELDPERIVETLSMPEQQMVEIAKAIGSSAKIIIMDEPTASLTDREVVALFDVIRSLRAQGVGIIYISHRLEEISSIADRVTVLRDGETIATRSMEGVTRNELIRMMVGRELSSVFPKQDVPIGDTILELKDVSSLQAGVRNVNLSLRRGEIFGLAGLVGSGRTQVAETLFGLTPADSGTIQLGGQERKINSPADAIHNGIAYVPEDRRQHGVVLQMPIAANATLACLRQVSRWTLLDEQQEIALTSSYVERLGIKTSNIYAEAGSLSGGNQQKVALARWLAVKPAILILDEPTQGVDVGAKSEIHRLMVELAREGLCILMISSELSEILGMSDRVGVMKEGRLQGILPRAAATQESIMAMALGHVEQLH